jgi:hypothetical protein
MASRRSDWGVRTVARRRILVVGVVIVPVVLGLGSLYRFGDWAPGPSSPTEREVCEADGGHEGDLFLIHRCAPGRTQPSAG